MFFAHQNPKAYLTSGNLKLLKRLNSIKNLTAHIRKESSCPVRLRSKVRRTCLINVLNADRRISMANSRRNNLKNTHFGF